MILRRHGGMAPESVGQSGTVPGLWRCLRPVEVLLQFNQARLQFARRPEAGVQAFPRRPSPRGSGCIVPATGSQQPPGRSMVRRIDLFVKTRRETGDRASKEPAEQNERSRNQ